MYRVSPFVRHFATVLSAGVGIATLWVNLSPATYYDAIEYRITIPDPPVWTGLPSTIITPITAVSDGLMPLFLFFIAKELWEALVLERGALAGRARVSMPLGAVIGGTIGAVLVWLLWSHLFIPSGDGGRASGWPLPIGSDVVLCYVFGRATFGRDHPALHLLLLITIAFDITALLALALTSLATLRPYWLIVPLVAISLVWLTTSRLARRDASERQHRRAYALWPYLGTGLLCWLGIVVSGLPAALGLLPLIPVIPHAERSFGLFAEAEEFLHDPLNRIAHLMVRPLVPILFLFGLTRGGVDVTAFSATSVALLGALWLGKPLGILSGALIAGALTGQLLPRGLRLSDLFLIALIAGCGFTVPLLALDTTLPGGVEAEAARLGLVVSLLAGPAALGLSRLRRRRPADPSAA